MQTIEAAKISIEKDMQSMEQTLNNNAPGIPKDRFLFEQNAWSCPNSVLTKCNIMNSANISRTLPHTFTFNASPQRKSLFSFLFFCFVRKKTTTLAHLTPFTLHIVVGLRAIGPLRRKKEVAMERKTIQSRQQESHTKDEKMKGLEFGWKRK